jgi:hypothetical protein
MICNICGATVGSAQGPLHTAWHEAHGGRLIMLEAHQENLIERVYALEGGDPPLPEGLQ